MIMKIKALVVNPKAISNLFQVLPLLSKIFILVMLLGRDVIQYLPSILAFSSETYIKVRLSDVVQILVILSETKGHDKMHV